MKIRLANQNDINSLAELWEELDKYNLNVLKLASIFEDKKIGGKGRYRKLIARHISDEDLVIVAEIEGKIAGFILCYVIDQFGNGAEDAVVDVTFVDESARSNGVGTDMYRYLENILIGRGVVGITTEVFDNNELSLNFHTKNGYKPIARSIEMYKPLTKKQ